ncbi:MAG: hypothetical protein PHC70_04355 [Patescibacteria group bacterium]|nr:hypothetical protein [Patescibacteria group bacterium]
MKGKVVRSGHDLVQVPSQKGKQKCFATDCDANTDCRMVINSDGVMNELPACPEHGGKAVDEERLDG